MPDETSQAPTDGAAAEPAAQPPRADGDGFARRVTLALVVLALVVFVYYVVSDRQTPYTDQARVGGFVIPIAPQVAGSLTEVGVVRHERVAEGDVLARIDRANYELALASAEASLESARQRVAAQEAAVESAGGRVRAAEAQLDIAQRDFDRMETITQANPGALSQADRDRTTAALAGAVAQLASAAAELDRARENLGVAGDENPSIKSAVSKRDRAQLDLERTAVRAPAGGLVENIDLEVGYFAQTGQPIMSVISMRDVWLEAHMTENNLGLLEVGQRARFVLDSAPGEIFEGTVRSIGFGVTQKQGDQRGALPTVSQASGWMRDPQRFPVIVEFDPAPVRGRLRAGGQANVIVHTGDRPLMNRLADLRLTIVSWLSYAR